MNGHSRIKSMFQYLTESEQKIASYLLNNITTKEGAQNLTSSNVAKAINVGQSSVIKLSKKLGYKGFLDLKFALSSNTSNTLDLVYKNIHKNIRVKDDLSVVAHKLMLDKIKVLNKTMLANDEKRFRKAINMIDNAPRILLVGIGASGLAAQDFCYKLLKIGKNASFQQDSHVQIASAQALSERDLLIAISFSGSLKEINQCVFEATKNGASCLAITGIHKNKLHQLAEHILFIVSNENSIRSSAMTSRIAQLSLLDVLFVGLIQLEPELSINYIEHSKEIIDDLK